jgi:hypothetical protein
VAKISLLKIFDVTYRDEPYDWLYLASGVTGILGRFQKVKILGGACLK